MGAGKTTVGKKLAQLVKHDFLDTDQQIEEKEGITISQIFHQKGEEYFRKLETECISCLLKECRGKVIAVGGGLPLREENRKYLKELGRVVYLKATPETIYKRVKKDTSRPLLQTANLKEKVRRMMEEREPFYTQIADLILTIDNKNIDQIISEIPVL